MIQGLLYYTWILSKNRKSKEYKPITRRHRCDPEFMRVGSLASRPFASAFILGQGGGKVISLAVSTDFTTPSAAQYASVWRVFRLQSIKDCMEHHIASFYNYLKLEQLD